MPRKPAQLKLPKSMGACADILFETKQARADAQKVVDELTARENAIKEHIIQNLPKSDTGASGKLARVSVVTKEVPRVEDWEAFYAYVAKTKQFDLMQKRLSDASVKERWEDGKKVPGVGKFNAVTVSLSKLR